jgi:hypothetical protein
MRKRNAHWSEREMEIVFGTESKGSTLEERARTSTKEFVRSQDQVAEWDPKRGATGWRMSAEKALIVFGMETLLDALEKGAAIIVGTLDEPAATIRERRLALGLSVDEVARRAGLEVELVEAAENTEIRSPMVEVLVPICKVLGLDPDGLGAPDVSLID